jgi:thymidylate kinase
MRMADEGRLIVLEGIDDAALSALAERLCHWLRRQGIAAEHTREPTYGPAGTQVRLAQQGRLPFDAASLALLWLADRLDHLEREDGILTWLAAGRHVLCVHYALFAYAHQWGQVEWPWLRQIDAPCRAPDLTLFIDTPIPEADGRCVEDVEGLRTGYLQAIERLQDEGRTIVVVDDPGAPDGVYRACRRYVADLLDLSLPADLETW